MADYELTAPTSTRCCDRCEPRSASPAVREMGENPWSASWHPALYLEAVGEAAISELGAPTYEELTYQAVKDRFGPLARPMVASTLASSNRTPAAVLSKLEVLVKVARRGLNITWKADGPQGGLLQVRSPRAVAAHVEGGGRGVLRYLFEVTQATGRIEQSLHTPTGHTRQFLVSW